MAKTAAVMNPISNASSVYHTIWFINFFDALFSKYLIRKEYKQVDVITDIYKNPHSSIKREERLKRDVSVLL